MAEINRDLELLLCFMEPIRELLLDDTVNEIMGNPDVIGPGISEPG